MRKYGKLQGTHVLDKLRDCKPKFATDKWQFYDWGGGGVLTIL